MGIIVKSIKINNTDNLIHLIADKDTNKAMIVDPAWDALAINSVLIKNKWQLEGILLTHTHDDHTSALNEILGKADIPVYVSRKEHELGLFYIKKPTYICDNDLINLGKSKIRVINTPGHTLGSVCFFADDILISGDTIFIYGCGRCDFNESDINQMWNSLQKIKKLPDNTKIYCGHDYGEKQIDTIKNQKLTNPYLLIDNKDFFIDFRMKLQSKYRNIPFSPSSLTEIKSIQDKYK